jgi:hypothetical protein
MALSSCKDCFADLFKVLSDIRHSRSRTCGFVGSHSDEIIES